jgi:hypothetical protein
VSCESASCESASCESASCESASCESASCESASLQRSRKVLGAVCKSGLFWALSLSFYFIKVTQRAGATCGLKI